MPYHNTYFLYIYFQVGQFIGSVDANSPAVYAGIKQGDRIVEVNGTNISNENHQQVVQRIKAVQNETKMLVVDSKADEYYKSKRLVIRGDMPNVQKFETPVTRPTSGEAAPLPVVEAIPDNSGRVLRMYHIL